MFKIDTSDLNRLTKDLKKIQKEFPAATRQAVNKTLTSVTSTAVKHVSSETGIKQKDVRKKLIISRARGNGLSAYIDATPGRAFNLIANVNKDKRKPNAFRGKLKSGKRKGQSRFLGVRAKAWNKTKTYKGTFIINTRNGPIVASRKGSQRSGRGKFKWIVGPSMRQEFTRAALHKALRAKVRESLPKELNAAIKYHISKR